MLEAISCAKEWHIRPLAAISFEQTNDGWTPLDFMLSRAYERLQAFKCPICGGWSWECSSDVSGTENVCYNIKEVHCRKTQRIEEYENSHAPSKEQVRDRHRTRKWGLWHKVDAGIERQYQNLYKMPTIEDMLPHLLERQTDGQ